MADILTETPEKLVTLLSKFLTFVRSEDKTDGPISFGAKGRFLWREEGYKADDIIKAYEALDTDSWKKEKIGDGTISKRATRAISKAGNLVNKNQQVDFKNRLNPNHAKFHPEAEKVLYDIFCNPACDDAHAFEEAMATFGAKYDTIAFLYYIKDQTRFLPISPSHFDSGFAELGIDFRTSRKCSWDNYQKFLSIIGDIRAIMEDTLPLQAPPRLIDAHSFIWIIQEDRFRTWTPAQEQICQIEQIAEDLSNRDVTGRGGQHSTTSTVPNRSQEVNRATKQRAAGICQFCKKPAPFKDRNGEPFLEVHHIKWLSRGGEDSTKNTVALCPNCHRRLHLLDDPDDIAVILKSIDN